MNQSQQKVLGYLTGNEDIDSVSVATLQKLVEEDPYFSVAHYLLAKKLKSSGDKDYARQIQKTALFFPNPYWLDYQLNGGVGQAIVVEDATAERVVETETTETLPSNEDVDTIHPVTTEFSTDELKAASDLAHQTLQESDETTSLPEPDEDISLEPAERSTDVLPLDQPEEEIATITRDVDEPTEKFLDQLDQNIDVTIHGGIDEAIEKATPALEAETEQVAEEMAGVIDGPAESTKAFLSETPDIDFNDREPTEEEYEAFQRDADDTDLPQPVLEDFKKDPEQDEHERMFLNIKAMLDASSEEANADTKNAYVPIDPYYTIDYFASQGIKLDLDQNPQDKLGQNLKKFTHWLKHMKKLGPEDAIKTIEVESEADIQQIADSSNTVREVVTEAMASVLEKQGKKDKAIELYNKLSFLNPDKRTYFADKIKNLKGI